MLAVKNWLSRCIVSTSLIPCTALLVAVVVAGCSRATDDHLATKVTLTKPYPVTYEGVGSAKISVQDAVMELPVPS